MFKEATVMDEKNITKLSEISSLAPLHNPVQTEVIRLCQDRQVTEQGEASLTILCCAGIQGLGRAQCLTPPSTPACHHTAICTPCLWSGTPSTISGGRAVRSTHPTKYAPFVRYGFHGPSHQYVAEQTAKLMGKPLSDLAIVSCHLGAGCSVAANLGGVSQDTSMGFSPLEGLMMGQRCGDVDASIVPYMASLLGLECKEVLSMLNTQSGFVGIAGTPDSRY